MANYTVEKIENGIATLRYADESWAEIVLTETMTAEDLDDLAMDFAPKTGNAPRCIKAGESRTAAKKAAEEAAEDNRPAWLLARLEAYGQHDAQLEYITENGLDKWQEHVAKIKADNPKPD
jgi:hypothetical protein